MITRTLNADRTALLIADLHPDTAWHFRPHAHICSARRIGGLPLWRISASRHPHLRFLGATDSYEQYLLLHLAPETQQNQYKPCDCRTQHAIVSDPRFHNHVYQPRCAAHENGDGETDSRYLSSPARGGTMDNLKFPRQCTSLLLHRIAPNLQPNPNGHLLTMNMLCRLSLQIRHTRSPSS